jgi:hypothetical protein
MQMATSTGSPMRAQDQLLQPHRMLPPIAGDICCHRDNRPRDRRAAPPARHPRLAKDGSVAPQLQEVNRFLPEGHEERVDRRNGLPRRIHRAMAGSAAIRHENQWLLRRRMTATHRNIGREVAVPTEATPVPPIRSRDPPKGGEGLTAALMAGHSGCAGDPLRRQCGEKPEIWGGGD